MRTAGKEWRGRIHPHADIVAPFDRVAIDIDSSSGAKLFSQRKRRSVALEGVNPELQVKGLLGERVSGEGSGEARRLRACSRKRGLRRM